MTTQNAPFSASTDRSKVLARVRHDRILEVLMQAGSVSVGEVAMRLGVSEMTVRRDLAELEKEGKLARTHGGAVRTAMPTDALPASDPELLEPTFRSRLSRNATAKQAIAAAAVNLTARARTLALDVGTTTYLLSCLLTDKPHLKIFTNSVRNAAKLGEGTAEVYLPGGRVRSDEMSISNASAVAQFADLWFDMAFVGVSGLTADGLYDYSFDDTDMKRVYLQRSTLKVVLCDASKFGRKSLVHIGMLSQIDLLICDAPPPHDIALALASAHVDVRVVKPDAVGGETSAPTAAITPSSANFDALACSISP